MASISNNAKDQLIDYIRTNSARIDVCSQEPTTYTEATSTYSLGYSTTISIGATTNTGTGGRQAEIPDIVDGSSTASGMGTHFAVTDGVGELLYSQALSSSSTIESGNLLKLRPHTITVEGIS